eukprot:g25615.t1
MPGDPCTDKDCGGILEFLPGHQTDQLHCPRCKRSLPPPESEFHETVRRLTFSVPGPRPGLGLGGSIKLKVTVKSLRLFGWHYQQAFGKRFRLTVMTPSAGARNFQQIQVYC